MNMQSPENRPSDDTSRFFKRPAEQPILRFRRRIASILFQKYTLLFSAAWLFLWGTGVLALRSAGLASAAQLGAGALGLLFPPLLAALFVVRSLPDAMTLGAILDRKNRAGGLFLASFETDLGDWNAFLPSLEIPPLTWQPGRPLLGLLFGVLFLGTALIVPVESLTAASQNRLQIEDRLQKLTKQLETLREENILSLEDVEERKLDLADLEKNAEGTSPVKTHDALDHMIDQVEKRAQEAFEQAEKKAETLNKAESLMEMFDEQLQGESEEFAKEMMVGLAEEIEKMLQENKELTEDLLERLSKELEDGTADPLTEELKKMLEEGKLEGLDKEQLKELAEAMKECKGGCERTLENLKKSGFRVDPETLKRLDAARKINAAEMRRILAEWAGQCRNAADCKNGKKRFYRGPKQDRWDRSAEETETSDYLENRTEEEGAAYKAITLPPPELEAFREARKIGISIGRPEANKESGAEDQGGALGEIRGGTGSANTQTIYPRHRGAAGRYFERDRTRIGQ